MRKLSRRGFLGWTATAAGLLVPSLVRPRPMRSTFVFGGGRRSMRRLEIWTGPKPPPGSLSRGTLLVSLDLPCFNELILLDVLDGIYKNFSAITGTAIASGTPGHARISGPENWTTSAGVRTGSLEFSEAVSLGGEIRVYGLHMLEQHQ
jgi:hypothetical protein